MFHVAIVGATDADRAAVAELLAERRGVVVDAVAHGYDELLAAQAEVASLLEATGRPFTIDTDVRAARLVVHTAERTSPNRIASIRAAGRRGAARAEQASGGGEDLRVDVVPAADIDVAVLGSTRSSFPPYESALAVNVRSGSVIYACTTGYLFRGGFGVFGSTAGHCGRLGDSVTIGNVAVDQIRANHYHSASRVSADVSLYSLSVRGWLHHRVVHVSAAAHRKVTGSFTNSQLAPGLQLCFQGRTSGGGNCAALNSANRVICCDSTGRSFVHWCMGYRSLAGDSGGPVYRANGSTTATAAGMLSAGVTINGRASTCFSTIDNIEAKTGTVIYSQ